MILASWTLPASNLCETIDCQPNLVVGLVVAGGVATVVTFIAWWGRKTR